ncbi:cytochrome b5 reductase 4 [Nilaparvata lugens]|uniref:cytochrome b5 reductase 4 n=2 Tax=Nilaparvata lugens TaxID=108931 RepID=UPI00193D3845|nr:cytochrome b5 reductase 4 [Nilaparvata lugens]
MASGSSGSATGNPRNKVALKPGHSLMDWIRLGNSGKDLTGVGGVPISVTREQLAQHKTPDDAWLCIRGIVYNVTHYMDFHPGGCEELMRGVGKDATSLFNQVHAWVNYQTILQKCVVGRLHSEEFTLPIPPPKKSSSLSVTSNNKSKSSVDWSQQLETFTLLYNLKTSSPQVQILFNEPDSLLCRINENHLDSRVTSIKLEGKITWPAEILINSSTGKSAIQLKLRKKKKALWKEYGAMVETENRPNEEGDEYWPAEITSINKQTHDSYLITLKNTKNVYNHINVGQHLLIKQDIKGEEVIRPYTPVPKLTYQKPCVGKPVWRSTSEEVSLLIKCYDLGKMSSWLCSQRKGSTVMLSNPKGSFNTDIFTKNITEVYLFAAGTGITPMLSVVDWLLKSPSVLKIRLLYFNKTRKDIILEDKLDQLASEESRFYVEHILSEPSSEWSGRRGHVSLDLLLNILPKHADDIPRSDFVCICGPRPFTALVEKMLKEHLEYTSENYYSFSGQ